MAKYILKKVIIVSIIFIILSTFRPVIAQFDPLDEEEIYEDEFDAFEMPEDTTNKSTNTNHNSTGLEDIFDEETSETYSELAGVKSKMTDALTQISKLNSDIFSYENDIQSLEMQIENLTNEISQTELNIKNNENKYISEKDLVDKRLVALYEAGTTTYLDVLLTSDDLFDFISKYYLMQELAEYDQKLLTDIENTKYQLQTDKLTLENTKIEMENTKSQVIEKRNSLEATLKSKQTLLSALSAKEAVLARQLEEFEEDKKDIANTLFNLTYHKNYTAVSPSLCEYISPIADKTNADITTGFYGYDSHTGADFACDSETPVLAVKDGTVLISTSLKNSNGSYRSYGEYVAIDHHDGTITLYAHMLPNSRTVVEGQEISQGQMIGLVGSTGNSTGPHLHFEVRLNNGKVYVDPSPYLPNGPDIEALEKTN